MRKMGHLTILVGAKMIKSCILEVCVDLLFALGLGIWFMFFADML